jgi:hypothetical protein
MTGHTHLTPVEIRLSSWIELADALVRGLAHTLSNRIGALMALMHLGPGDPAIEERGFLAAEIDRLQEINRALKLLPADLNPRQEAVFPADVVRDALELIGMHPRAKETDFVVREQSDQPVRVERWALLRLTLIVLDTAREITMARGGDHVHVSIAGDEQSAVVTATPSGSRQSQGLDSSTDSLADLLARTGAACSVTPTEISLRIPALLELRRRERNPG